LNEAISNLQHIVQNIKDADNNLHRNTSAVKLKIDEINKQTEEAIKNLRTVLNDYDSMSSVFSEYEAIFQKKS
jgi:methyl-accepting chemotaxis protein